MTSASGDTVFGNQVAEYEIEIIDDFVGKFYAYLVSFTTDAANRIVRNSGEGNDLEVWRRLHSEYDPISSMRRVAILQQVQNPPRCERVEDLGPSLEKLPSKKSQYELFTDRKFFFFCVCFCVCFFCVCVFFFPVFFVCVCVFFCVFFFWVCVFFCACFCSPDKNDSISHGSASETQ